MTLAWYRHYKNVKYIFLSMCYVKVFLTFTSLSLVLLLTTVLPVLLNDADEAVSVVSLTSSSGQNGTYPWSSATQVFRSDQLQPSHNDV
jgi:hypothetical protein